MLHPVMIVNKATNNKKNRWYVRGSFTLVCIQSIASSLCSLFDLFNISYKGNNTIIKDLPRMVILCCYYK